MLICFIAPSLFRYPWRLSASGVLRGLFL